MIPLFIIGAPRSGTTFFTTAINAHPQVFITNELRQWSLVADIYRRTQKPTELLPEHPLRAPFRRALLRSLRQTADEVYRDHVTKANLGCPTRPDQKYARIIKVGGDKNPGYADGVGQPRTLEIIKELKPAARFIHVHRDPRSAIASYLALKKVYNRDLARSITWWRNHVETVLGFFAAQKPEDVRTVCYEDFADEQGSSILREIYGWLEIDDVGAPYEWLEAQRKSRTPLRSPTTPVAKLGKTVYQDRLSPEDIAEIEAKCGDLMDVFGYARSS